MGSSLPRTEHSEFAAFDAALYDDFAVELGGESERGFVSSAASWAFEMPTERPEVGQA